MLHVFAFSYSQLYVSTLDGKISTLDLSNKGALQWSVLTEPGELLSSSIHRLELTNNGKYVRMIPSLNGGIYKFDGDSIEAIPVTAEDLLKSSFKFSDDMVISGGKESRSYGINTRTGRVIYECSMAGCTNLNITEVLEDEKEVPTDDLDDILVVKRQTQVVRAIEPRSGVERWNFSIGHHELEILQNENCQSDNSRNDGSDNFLVDIDIRVIVPEGVICGYSKETPNTLLWKQKFDAPIVNVFRMDANNQIYSIDLFKNVQWLWDNNENFKPTYDSKLTPSVYLGMYHQQLYIQESDSIQASLDHHKKLEHNLLNDDSVLPIIPFEPYPASSTSLITLDGGDTSGEESSFSNENINSQELIKIDSQSVLYASQYVNGKGFYFFTKDGHNDSTQCGKKTRSTNITPNEFDNVTFKNHGLIPRNPSLLDYWKEISVIALTTAFVINMMLNNPIRRSVPGIPYVTVNYGKEALEYQEEEHPDFGIVKIDSQPKIRSASESNSLEDHSQYISRFLTDFDLVRVLGKGGFGVVFEVKNKLDDCNYAIKRILLPTKKESRERVMREVKTLANCEHKNIVRYFHAWVEQPPKGWQELKDKDLLAHDILSTSITIDSPSPTEESKAFIMQKEIKGPSVNPWITNFPMSDPIESLDFNKTSTIDDTSSFIQFKADSCDLDGSKVEEIEDSHEDSFKIEFKDSTEVKTCDNTDNSHVISIKESTSRSWSKSQTNKIKNGHRRQLSLDLTSVSDLKSKKPNVVVNGTPQKMYLYIQMQLCMKNSLKDWLRANDLQTRNGKTYEIWNQIIEAVHYVHLKGLIHRDLKPSNIFFSLDGQIKIGDFGLVTDMAESPIDPLTSSSSNSNSSTNFDFTNISHKKHTQRVGTSLYMSPEQSKGLPYNYKVDIFSLGLILFELLNYFNTETERYKVLDDIRKHIFPKEFVDGFEEEVRA